MRCVQSECAEMVVVWGRGIKRAPWENGLVYIRMSFVFIYSIDGYQIVEYTHLIGIITQLFLSAIWL